MALGQDYDAPPTPRVPVPAATRRRPALCGAERLIGQIEAVELWNRARRMRERVLDAAATRDDQQQARHQIDVLRRTQLAIAEVTARALRQSGDGPMLGTAPTAVIAHRHTWFADKVSALLTDGGVQVVACTDNGADALGAVIAEQPDIVLTGELLVMMPGKVLLAESRLFAPTAFLAVQTGDVTQAEAWRPYADAVYVRHDPPSDVADALCAVLRRRDAERQTPQMPFAKAVG